MPRYIDYMISPYPLRIITIPIDPSKLKLQSLYIHNVGHLPGRTSFRHDSKFTKWAFIYLAGGKGTYQVNGGIVQRVERGSLLFLRPDVPYNYGPDANGYWDEYYFTFEGSRIEEWLNSWLTDVDIAKQVGSEDATQFNRIERIFLLMESGLADNIDRAALLLESLLFEFILKAQVPAETTKTQQVITLMDDLGASLFETFDAASVAKRHHISVSTLRRVVSEYTGYPLNAYIHRLKMAEAKNILLNTNNSIKEIADSLGYKDVFYFSRLFKKYVGDSPHIYRNKMQL
ncbi:AraC family transcriptional regulator [Paenibacillus alba]|uniref:AraC family transcriptional regulator n=1 Tax=Paenibacillus alba TaxID=1197127 RepID=A0ABU6GCW5_9BACL|nr:helix-turn-helix domain-containing protein [Paenibacillus alba]MEC0231464.1 AraC family transcriptional regulator [Paenibacillus alba]NQX65865.1 AraC family transcriptional regulator [Paenibacillus alba]